MPARKPKPDSSLSSLTAKIHGNQKYTVEQVRDALARCAGNYTEAAMKLNTSRQTIAMYVGRFPELQTFLAEMEDALIDYAEGKLKSLLDCGDKTAMIFYLRTKGRKRGWIQGHEHSGPGGGAIPVSFDFSRLSDIELDKLIELRQKVGAPAT